MRRQNPASETRPVPRSLRTGRLVALATMAFGLLLTSCFSNPYDDPGSAAARAEAALEAEETGDRPDAGDGSGAGAGTNAASSADTAQGDSDESDAAESSTERAVDAVSGKGQYLWEMEKIGTPAQVVSRAKQAGLDHLVIRAASSAEPFYIQATLDELLPLAHDAGIKVVAYDGPAMEDIPGDVTRAQQIIDYRAPSGDGIDAFAADIELTRATNLDDRRAREYTALLRETVGPDYPLIAIVMNPNYHETSSNYVDGGYPFEELAAGFDVFNVMDYWTGVTDDGAAFVAKSIQMLEKYGLPVSVIGQAYPIEIEHTYPPPDRVQAAMQAAKDHGAVGMSFWSWQTTRPGTWEVIDGFRW